MRPNTAVPALLRPHDTSTLTVGASPYTFIASRAGFVTVAGGTVSSIEHGRSSFNSVGVVAGCIPLATFDSVRVTYTVAPTMRFVPL